MEASSGNKFERLAEAAAHFERLVHDPAWQDYMAMVKGLREVITTELLRGTVDKFGENHDDEKRALIHTLGIILDYPASVQRDFVQASKIKADMEARMSPPGGLYGLDRLGP